MIETGLLGAVEAGGTKFRCAIADRAGTIVAETRIATTQPAETLAAATSFFESGIRDHGQLAALSIGSFGPLSLNRLASDYGAITSTPKPGWRNVDLLGHFRRAVDVPLALDTDVNCAAVGEHLFGSGRGLDTFCYVTVGTGIGVGVFIGGGPHGGANHPEAGHIRLPRAPGDEAFAGMCPFHGDCLEGLASGPAMRARWGIAAEDLSDDHPAWLIEADYLAGLCASLTYLVRPDRIIIGGGVMTRHDLLARIRVALVAKLAGYDASISRLAMADYVVAPAAGESAGIAGALAIAYRLVTQQWPMHWAIGAQAPLPAPTAKAPAHA